MNARVEAGSQRPGSGHVHQQAGDVFTCDRRQDFVPNVIRTHRGGRWRRVDRSKNAGEWAKFVHRSEMLVFDVDDGGEGGPGIVTGVIPSKEDATARLAAFAPVPGTAVAEIGTDCGWTAAALEHLLQGGQVVTVADTERLAEIARQRLRPYPRVRVVSGSEAGVLGPAGAFHGLLSHRAVRRVPWEWVTRVRPGGRLCLPVRTALGGSSTLLVLTVARDGASASGRFHAGPAPQTMWFREHRPGEGTSVESQGSPRASETLDARGRTYGPRPGCSPACSALTFGCRSCAALRSSKATLPTACVFMTTRRRGQWSSSTPRIYEWGPRDLGSDLFDALGQWHAVGEPEVEQLGVTITETEHTLWLGAPDGPSWRLPELHTITGEVERHAT